MKKFAIITAAIIISACFNWSCDRKRQPATTTISKYILCQLDTFVVAKNHLLNAVNQTRYGEKELQHLFLQLRLSYKKSEWAIEYFTPLNAQLMNGAPVPEVDKSRIVSEPAGLQVIESMLFPHYDSSKKPALKEQLLALQWQIDKIKLYFENIDLLDWQVFDALKLEVFRVEALGITGFDNPLTLRSMQESATSLLGIEYAISFLDQGEYTKSLSAAIDSSVSYLLHHTDFNSFDRAEFIRSYLDNVSVGITQLEKKLHIHEVVYKRLLNQDASTLSDTDAFDAFAYTLEIPDSLTTPRTILGKRLFGDPFFSENGKRSCQSCHRPKQSFTDGLVKNFSIKSHELLARNTPTLINAALQPSLFYDERVATLEEQANDVIHNTHEMNGSIACAINKLQHNKSYQQLFLRAFPKHTLPAIDSSEVLMALSDYIRSLVMLNSRFDEYMRGNSHTLTQEEVEGFNLFMGKAKCATCHYFPLFNGTFPPTYTRSEAEVIGVPLDGHEKKADTDMGMYKIIKLDFLQRAFKTPTVRNAGTTAPYMHNGVFASLKEVIDFYDKGGGRGLDFIVPDQTLPASQLRLSNKEKAALIAFIKSLDSKLSAKKN
ncbi:MAG TPA: cytochrome c peroxidase [Chitinophagaceae bacterium]|nr:cytochrome c peroxidase [Chitinophagaceae bacterium]